MKLDQSSGPKTAIPRHLTEYTGLDLEMAIEEHYHEALEMIDGTLKSIYSGIYEHYGQELEAVKRHFPHEDLVWLEDTPRIPFKEGVKLLAESGWVDENGNPPSPYEDLHTRDEIRLGELVKQKYHTTTISSTNFQYLQDHFIPCQIPRIRRQRTLISSCAVRRSSLAGSVYMTHTCWSSK